MAHRSESNLVETVVQLINDSGMSQMAEVVRIMLNEAMRIERSRVIEAEPYQRGERRKGYANGYKPKTLDTRLGEITFQVPQTRDVEFYPSALEKGIRSERALKLAIAEMYVKGVSTRKVTGVTPGVAPTRTALAVTYISAYISDYRPASDMQPQER